MLKAIKAIVRKHFVFILILIIGAALRFYRLDEMSPFDFDQEYAVNFAYSVLREYPIQLIGQGLSVQGLFMGPLYFYYLVPFFAIFSLHPIGGAVGSVILGLIIILAYYYYGTKFFGVRTGLTVALLRTFLFRNLELDWSVVPAYSSELLVLVTLDCFYQYWRGNLKYLPILGLVFGLYTSFHPILFPFYVVFIGLAIIKRRLGGVKTLLLSAFSFLIPVTPLLVFEYFHKFLEVKKLISLFGERGVSEVFLPVDKAGEYSMMILNGFQYRLGLESSYFNVLPFFVLILMALFTLFRIDFWEHSFHFVVLSITSLVFVVYYVFLPVHIVGYYFLAPVTLFLFYFSAMISCFLVKPRIKVLVVVFLLFLAWTNFKLLDREKWSNPNLTTLAHKDKIVKAILDRQPKNEEFFVSYLTSPGWNSGFSYLLRLNGLVPKDKPIPKAVYTVVAPRSLSPGSIRVASGNIGLIPPEDEN